MVRFFISPGLILAAALAVAGCASTTAVSRNAPFEAALPTEATAMQDWSIEAVDVVVPRSLSVSEANTLKPRADLVWRGDPHGDRYQQVETLMQDALAAVLKPREGAATPVIVTLTVTRFHAITQRARYTVGGAHEIEFQLALHHAKTGIPLADPRPVALTFRASGGRQAIEEEAQGRTQSVVVSERLQAWAETEFAAARHDFLALAQPQN